MSVQALEGARYFITFIDDYKRNIWEKFWAFKTFKEFKTGIEKECCRQIKVLMTHSGGKYTTNEFTDCCKQRGIRWEFSASYTTKQKGIAIKKIRALPERAESTGGYCFNLDSVVISQCNKKHLAAALSCTEAEYRDAVKVTCVVIWMRTVLTDVRADKCCW